MKKTYWIFLLTALCATSRLQAQIASFNFSAAAVSVSGWTNVAGDPSVAVRTATVGGITLSSVATGNWAPLSGIGCALNGYGAASGTFFPANVMSNAWFQYNGTSYDMSNYSPGTPQLELTGLNPDSTYTLVMSGSNTSNYNTNPTYYTVSGAIVYTDQSLDVHNNTSQGITFPQVKSDSTGTIRIYVNTSTSTNAAMICGLQVFPGSSSVSGPTVAITTPVNGTQLAEGVNVTIQATASEIGGTVAKVQFYADTTLIGEVDTPPYNFTWTDPAPGSYQLNVKATDNIGVVNTASVNIAVESLNYFWSTTGNIATNGDSNFIGSVDTNRLSFRTNDIERMTILKDGTIGIGTKTTYGYALAVNGTGIFTKVRVKTAGTWPDYVFAKNYRLPGLKELEEYLARYRHLPGMASEAEVQKDGIDIGDNQAALLKKVEELTLYLIDENKRLQAQAGQMQAQTDQMKTQQDRLDRQQKEIDELKKLIAEKK